MRQRFTKERLTNRINTFCDFVKSNACNPEILPKEQNNVQPFLVQNNALEWAKVIFTPLGGIHIVACPGPRKTLLLAWIKHEQPRCRDLTTDEKLEKLDHLAKTYNLSSSSLQTKELVTVPTKPSIRLIPGDSPLVELAENLGYSVYITSTDAQPQEHLALSRYSVTTLEGQTFSGHNLVEALAALIKMNAR